MPRNTATYWILSGDESCLTHVFDCHVRDGGGNYIAFRPNYHSVDLSMMDWATVIDLRTIKDADVIDVIRINDRTLTIKIGDVGNEQEYQYCLEYLPEGIDEDTLLGEFAYRVKQINDTGAVAPTLHVWDAVDGWLSGEITPRPHQYVDTHPKEQVLAIVDRIVAEKDEQIAKLEEKWKYYNDLLICAERARDAYKRESGEYWKKWGETVDELEGLHKRHEFLKQAYKRARERERALEVRIEDARDVLSKGFGF